MSRALRGRRLALAWFVTVTPAEFLGFTVPAVAGALTVDSAVALPVLLIAGAVEGAVLGAGQARGHDGGMPHRVLLADDRATDATAVGTQG